MATALPRPNLARSANDSGVAAFVKKMGDKMTYRVALDDQANTMAMTWMKARESSPHWVSQRYGVLPKRATSMAIIHWSLDEMQSQSVMAEACNSLRLT